MACQPYHPHQGHTGCGRYAVNGEEVQFRRSRDSEGYTEYLTQSELQHELRAGRILKGRLTVQSRDPNEAFVDVHRELVSGGSSSTTKVLIDCVQWLTVGMRC